jgi:hypothetical protein
MLVAPAALRAMARKQVTTGTPKTIRHSLRKWFYGLWRALPGVPGLFSHRRPELIIQDLIPASEDQDHALSPSASAALVQRCQRVHRIPAHVS